MSQRRAWGASSTPNSHSYLLSALEETAWTPSLPCRGCTTAITTAPDHRISPPWLGCAGRSSEPGGAAERFECLTGTVARPTALHQALLLFSWSSGKAECLGCSGAEVLSHKKGRGGQNGAPPLWQNVTDAGPPAAPQASPAFPAAATAGGSRRALPHAHCDGCPTAFQVPPNASHPPHSKQGGPHEVCGFGGSGPWHGHSPHFQRVQSPLCAAVSPATL